jgi:acylphosphatase
MALKILIKGKVQGIFFRSFVKKTAERLGVTGSVKNLPDGNVEVIAEGAEKPLQILLQECSRGPPEAAVEDVKVTKTKDRGLKTFEIQY